MADGRSLQRRTLVVRIFPNAASYLGLVRAVPIVALNLI
jgi:hypothetical protein